MATDEFILVGYEQLEISTQIIIREAFRRGLEIKVLDWKENFLEISGNGKTEFIKEASKTSVDTYMSFLLMENKTLSRYILDKHNLPIAGGRAYENIEEAYEDFTLYKDKKVVIKPTTTNFGIGIYIKDAGVEEASYRSYVESAFSHSSSIIIEDFLIGPEYRFLVIDFQVIAICNRVPANVLGDGKKSIRELVEDKNQDPRRGVGHITPLEKIQLGDIEAEILQGQGYTFDSILAAGETAYLRKNSNISTGGDSLDVTDDVHPLYKEIAERAARSVPAKICGVDIIIEDIKKEPDASAHGILELNFNPVLYIHEFPYQGKSREVGKHILDLIGF
ncbi:MAG: bifunctional glutamate--cysteine ligase GshA/glutathione synthetase GshB [Spirochaetota bacterium]